MKRHLAFVLSLTFAAVAIAPCASARKPIIHDAEYYVVASQHTDDWAAEDADLDTRLQALREKHGKPPNIVYVLWDDTAFGAVGFPGLQKNFGYETPQLNDLAAAGINFTRMYTEPSCTPTRAAFLTGRIPVRHGMGVVGMPHEFSGIRAEEVTIAEVLSKQGYATAHFGKGHLGDIEESYLHNQGFDEALFTPMNQITSLYNPQGTLVNAAIGFSPEVLVPDPYQLDDPGLLPKGWVQIIEGKKGEQGAEWCGTSNECYDKMDAESEKRTLEFIRRNAEADKPFFVQYWPNFINFLAPVMERRTVSGGKVAEGLQRFDDFIGALRAELRELGIAENTLLVVMADNGPMVHNPPAGWGMLEMLYRGGKGDFTEGGVRTPAFAEWPGTIGEGQLVGDIIYVGDLYTTFARLGGALPHVPTDRVIDGIDQTALLMNGDTHSRRDYVHIYQGHTLAATVKGRYKKHWLSRDAGGASGIGADYYDLYTDHREANPMMVPLIHTQGQFDLMRKRHELLKKKYPDMPNGRGIPLTGLSNARPETKAIADRIRRNIEAMPFEAEGLLEANTPWRRGDMGDWGR